MSELKPCPVTQIQAYRAYEKLLEIMEDETDDQTEVFSTAYKALYRIANGRRAKPANEPLTLDELRGMAGEPVYDGHALQWYVIEDVDVVDELSTIIHMTDGTDFDSEDGLPPLFRRKPERSENDG